MENGKNRNGEKQLSKGKKYPTPKGLDPDRRQAGFSTDKDQRDGMLLYPNWGDYPADYKPRSQLITSFDISFSRTRFFEIFSHLHSKVWTAPGGLVAEGVDLFALLGVAYMATQEEVETTYNAFLQEYHPDKLVNLEESERSKRTQFFSENLDRWRLMLNPLLRERYVWISYVLRMQRSTSHLDLQKFHYYERSLGEDWKPYPEPIDSSLPNVREEKAKEYADVVPSLASRKAQKVEEAKKREEVKKAEASVVLLTWELPGAFRLIDSELVTQPIPLAQLEDEHEALEKTEETIPEVMPQPMTKETISYIEDAKFVPEVDIQTATVPIAPLPPTPPRLEPKPVREPRPVPLPEPIPVSIQPEPVPEPVVEFQSTFSQNSPKKVSNSLRNTIMAILGAGAVTGSVASLLVFTNRYLPSDEVENVPESVPEQPLTPPPPVPETPEQAIVEQSKEVKRWVPVPKPEPPVLTVEEPPEEIKVAESVEEPEVVSVQEPLPKPETPPVEEVKGEVFYTSTGWRAADFEECPSEWKTEWTDQGYVAGLFVVCKGGKFRNNCRPLNQQESPKIYLNFGAPEKSTRIDVPYNLPILTPTFMCQEKGKGAFTLFFREEKSGK